MMGRYNFQAHARQRVLERSEQATGRKDPDEYDWKPVRYVDRLKDHDPDTKYIYCKELELLGKVKGLKVLTVVPRDSDKFELENGKYNRIEEDDSGSGDVELDERVKEDLNRRQYE